MRKITLKPILAASMAVFLSLGTVSCAGLTEKGVSPQTQEAIASLATSYATSKFILQDENPGERAQRVVAVIDGATALLEGDAVSTLELLEKAVRDQINWTDLPPPDQVLVNGLIKIVRAELQARLGSVGMTSETKVKVLMVLQWVRDAAAPYAAT